RPQIRRAEDRLPPRHARGHRLAARQPPDGDRRRPAPGHGRDQALRRQDQAAGVLNVPGPSTRAVPGGEPRTKMANAVTEPIVQTATYTFANTAELADHFEGRIERQEYGRYGNPTQRIAEQKLAALEGAEDGLLFSSGMAAITTTLFAMLSKGAHVVIT